MFLSLDGNNNIFDIGTGVLQGGTLALYLLIICQDYILRRSVDLIKENDFALSKKPETDDADNLALLAKRRTKAESVLYSL